MLTGQADLSKEARDGGAHLGGLEVREISLGNNRSRKREAHVYEPPWWLPALDRGMQQGIHPQMDRLRSWGGCVTSSAGSWKIKGRHLLPKLQIWLKLPYELVKPFRKTGYMKGSKYVYSRSRWFYSQVNICRHSHALLVHTKNTRRVVVALFITAPS